MGTIKKIKLIVTDFIREMRKIPFAKSDLTKYDFLIKVALAWVYISLIMW